MTLETKFYTNFVAQAIIAFGGTNVAPQTDLKGLPDFSWKVVLTKRQTNHYNMLTAIVVTKVIFFDVIFSLIEAAPYTRSSDFADTVEVFLTGGFIPPIFAPGDLYTINQPALLDSTIELPTIGTQIRIFHCICPYT